MKKEYAAVWLEINERTNEIGDWQDTKDISTINGAEPVGYFVREVDESGTIWPPVYERR